jgi:hypothetical protein
MLGIIRAEIPLIEFGFHMSCLRLTTLSLFLFLTGVCASLTVCLDDTLTREVRGGVVNLRRVALRICWTMSVVIAFSFSGCAMTNFGWLGWTAKDSLLRGWDPTP